MKLSVHLVTWNSSKYLPYLFKSLREQTCRDWELLVIDNNSEDDTVEILKKELSNFSVHWRIIENKENKGFAGAHNQALRATASQYALLINPDLCLAPDCLEKLLVFMETSDAAIAAPRLMRWNFVNNDRTNIIDSLGLKILRSRRVVEMETGEEWRERSGAIEVFGVSGTTPILRRSAVEQIFLPGDNVFDESYHSYKEDVDLAYRLRSAGYKAYTVLDAVAYHDRSAVGLKDLGDSAAASNKAYQSAFIKYHSYKNHLATLYKNEYWQNTILDLPWILWYETKKLLYFLLFDQSVLAGLRDIWQKRKELKVKRLKVKSLRKVSWRELRKWWK